MLRPKQRVLFVGAFPPEGSQIRGGNITDCTALLGSSFAKHFDLVLLDTTQRSVPPPNVAVRTMWALKRIAKFVKLMESTRPDAVLLFASSGFSFGEKALLAAYARLRGAGTVLSVRSGHFMDKCRRDKAFRLVARLLVCAPHYLLCQGIAWQQFFERTLCVPQAKCPVIDSWVATESLLRIGADRGRDSGDVVKLLFVGWVERFKGIHELLSAVQALSVRSEIPSFHLTIAGDGGAAKDAAAWVKSNGLETLVTFKGWVGPGEMKELLADASVFVLPSYTEGLPNSMIEAMAAGLPVVVTPVGSIPDVIATGREGVLVPPRDAVALTGALAGLVQDHVARERMGRAAYKTAAARFSVERGASGLVALLSRVSMEAAR